VKPTKPITPGFVYTPAANTDISKTFARVRAEQERVRQQKRRKEQEETANVVNIKR